MLLESVHLLAIALKLKTSALHVEDYLLIFIKGKTYNFMYNFIRMLCFLSRYCLILVTALFSTIKHKYVTTPVIAVSILRYLSQVSLQACLLFINSISSTVYLCENASFFIASKVEVVHAHRFFLSIFIFDNIFYSSFIKVLRINTGTLFQKLERINIISKFSFMEKKVIAYNLLARGIYYEKKGLTFKIKFHSSYYYKHYIKIRYEFNIIAFKKSSFFFLVERFKVLFFSKAVNSLRRAYKSYILCKEKITSNVCSIGALRKPFLFEEKKALPYEVWVAVEKGSIIQVMRVEFHFRNLYKSIVESAVVTASIWYERKLNNKYYNLYSFDTTFLNVHYWFKLVFYGLWNAVKQTKFKKRLNKSRAFRKFRKVRKRRLFKIHKKKKIKSRATFFNYIRLTNWYRNKINKLALWVLYKDIFYFRKHTRKYLFSYVMDSSNKARYIENYANNNEWCEKPCINFSYVNSVRLKRLYAKHYFLSKVSLNYMVKENKQVQLPLYALKNIFFTHLDNFIKKKYIAMQIVTDMTYIVVLRKTIKNTFLSLTTHAGDIVIKISNKKRNSMTYFVKNFLFRLRKYFDIGKVYRLEFVCARAIGELRFMLLLFVDFNKIKVSILNILLLYHSIYYGELFILCSKERFRKLDLSEVLVGVIKFLNLINYLLFLVAKTKRWITIHCSSISFKNKKYIF
jgi:hypothetical protein